MADNSAIEWTDATWNPIVGCSLVSPGCTNCYAMRMAARLEAMGSASHYAGTTMPGKAGAVWTGKLAPAPDHILTQPRRWRRPRRIFVNSMGDLFHESVPDEWIDRVFAVMALCPEHTFQMLTKRPRRMRAYLFGRSLYERLYDEPSRKAWPNRTRTGTLTARNSLYEHSCLPNVLHGVSVEDQRRANEHRPYLSILAKRGASTFVSYEPALGPVDWTGWEFLSGLISGGESGPCARPTHPDWHRAARDFCAAHGIPYFFKQWGAWEVAIDRDNEDPDWRADYARKFDGSKPDIAWLNLDGGQGFHGERFHVMRRVGKARAGRLLDGREHNDLPRRTAA
ncbi:phage Gp37/Gp68 family protein [Xanthobacter sp. 91]|uniref:phage Gp37/Gp68 family protein n=1 Tax=Xanthobacter sp. 91 TaxID=1117244 RepID=UPI000497C596|nr:phage Gp37/Gp68 family protein [Xanthobacter sp. 91]